MSEVHLNLVGATFGKLKVLSKDGSKWLCKCECGNITHQDSYNLTHGRALSCGCYRKERLVELHAANSTHSLHEYRDEYRKERREENKQASTCRFCKEDACYCTLLRKLYCDMEICNWWKPIEGRE